MPNTYTIWLEYGFTVSTDETLDPDNHLDYYRLVSLAENKLNEIGLAEIISEASLSDISIKKEMN